MATLIQVRISPKLHAENFLGSESGAGNEAREADHCWVCFANGEFWTYSVFTRVGLY